MSIIQVQGLRKVYGSRAVVDDVSFSVEEGEIFGLLGPNGAGKTTTVECIEGLRAPDAGTVVVGGFDPVREHDEVTAILGVQLQDSELQAKLTVQEAFELYSSFYTDPVAWRPLAGRLGLDPLLGCRFGRLSGGEKQRLLIGLSLVGRPRVVVFDELTTALDPRSRRETWTLVEEIRDAGTTVVLVTHFMEEAERLCDRLVILDAGRVVALGTPTSLIARSESPVVISFRPARPLADAELRALPDVAASTHDGRRVVLHGSDETVAGLLALLARREISPHELRVVDATLDDAFLSLTRRTGTGRPDPVGAAPAGGA